MVQKFDMSFSVSIFIDPSGLRSIRYALELDDVTDLLVAGDLDPGAVRTMESNRERNGISKDKLRGNAGAHFL